MIYNILLESAHNKDFQEIAGKIFRLEPEEIGIIHTVAKNGPMRLTNIAKKTENYTKWHCTRWAAKRRIEGTPKTLGLIPNEFLIAKDHQKRIRGKEGKMFYLSTKGLFAAFVTGLSMEQTYLYKDFMKFLKKQTSKEITNRPNPKQACDISVITDLFEEYIKNKIYLFLIWHESEGIDVTRIKSFQMYLIDFFSKVDETFNSKFHNIDKSKETLYLRLLQKNVILSKTIQALDMVAHPNKNFGSEDQDVNEFFLDRIAMGGEYMWRWPYYMEKMQFAKYDENNIPSLNPGFIYNPEIGLDIGNTINIAGKRTTFFDIVKKELEKLGVKKEYSDTILHYIWDKPLKEFETVKATNLQI